MSLPDWRSFPGGATKRAALWLASEVGLDGVFTKEQLRLAFPGVTQIDRRVRDLRAEGWAIYTNREDVTLLQDEQRLAAIGGHVWEQSYSSAQSTTISAKQRQEVLAADGYACVACGIAGGEPFPDDRLRRAKLAVKRHEDASSQRGAYVTLCDRCLQGRHEPVPIDRVIADIRALDPQERVRLDSWIRGSRREPTPEEYVWAMYRLLPSSHRALVRDWVSANPE